jgi:hypothetical protein
MTASLPERSNAATTAYTSVVNPLTARHEPTLAKGELMRATLAGGTKPA